MLQHDEVGSGGAPGWSQQRVGWPEGEKRNLIRLFKKIFANICFSVLKLVNLYWTWHQWDKSLRRGGWRRSGWKRWWVRLSCIDGWMAARLGEGWKRKLKRHMGMSEGRDKQRKGRTMIKLSGRCVKGKQIDDILGRGRKQHVRWTRFEFVYTAICYHGTNHIL